MKRPTWSSILVVALATACGAALIVRDKPLEESTFPSAPSAMNRPAEQSPAEVLLPGQRDGRLSESLERRVEKLANRLADEVEQRRRLEVRLSELEGRLASLGSGEVTTAGDFAETDRPPVAAVASAPPPSDGAAPEPDGSVTPMERALLAAGVDSRTVSEIKRRNDEVTLSEIYLRDQASREGWLDTPEFADELAAIQQQRVSIREQIGEDAYDRYLAALAQPNRVAVNEVLQDSPAAAAGLQPGDLVLRYADARIFAPNELVDATRSGRSGEWVRLEVQRGGQRFEVQVPRGPLGVVVAGSRSDPGEG
jgi:hypothetical protein